MAWPTQYRCWLSLLVAVHQQSPVCSTGWMYTGRRILKTNEYITSAFTAVDLRRISRQWTSLRRVRNIHFQCPFVCFQGPHGCTLTGLVSRYAAPAITPLGPDARICRLPPGLTNDADANRVRRFEDWFSDAFGVRRGTVMFADEELNCCYATRRVEGTSTSSACLSLLRFILVLHDLLSCGSYRVHLWRARSEISGSVRVVPTDRRPRAAHHRPVGRFTPYRAPALPVQYHCEGMPEATIAP